MVALTSVSTNTTAGSVLAEIAPATVPAESADAEAGAAKAMVAASASAAPPNVSRLAEDAVMRSVFLLHVAACAAGAECMSRLNIVVPSAVLDEGWVGRTSG